MSIISIIIFFGSFLGITSCDSEKKLEDDQKLGYDRPAQDWMTEALPIGNGYGRYVFDGIEKKQIQFAEGSLWSGGPGSSADYFQGSLDDTGLEDLYFPYGSYLMISGSRPGTMPLNLQGKWNIKIKPTWASDYPTNIYLQMLYWPAEVKNLSECHLPLFSYMESLVDIKNEK
jgi:hypothetical protein